ncbi:hypothetical protein N0V93_002305 [Gnomoniopsis smithogilvyi]|uniref:Uncharacterized protein n=1 Tax=Gnomoniopsis smithogilvyi TaxID=1191159 RepID=A0A9W8YWE0_9PEZI|nr:hypothetical protein N0V93_002305 [Gnomoniopsis smithogilvyi]
MADKCTDPDNIVCEGLNGLKSLVTPFLPGAGPATPTMPTTSFITLSVASSVSTISEDVSSSPSPPPAFQSTLPSTITEISTSTSVVEAGISATQPFITNLPTAPTSIPNTLPTSTLSSTSQPPTTTASAGAEAAAPIVAQAQSFPTGLVAGLSVTLVVLVGSGIALWYFCLRRRSRNRPMPDYSGEEASVVEIYRPNHVSRSTNKTDSTDGARQPNVAYDDTSMREVQERRISRPESWQPRPPSIFTLTDNRTSFEDTESVFPEPLSPRPVVQQTLQRVSMPRPVDASIFKSGGRQSNSGDSSDTSNTYSVRQVVVKRPAPGRARERSASPALQSKPKLNQVRESAKVLAKLNSLATRRKAASDAESTTSAASREVPIGLVSEQPEAEESSPANKVQKTYSLRRSPLAQNPFTDPTNEDWRVQSDAEESMESPTLKTANPDTAQESQDNGTPEPFQNDEAEKQGQEPEDSGSKGLVEEEEERAQLDSK